MDERSALGGDFDNYFRDFAPKNLCASFAKSTYAFGRYFENDQVDAERRA